MANLFSRQLSFLPRLERDTRGKGHVLLYIIDQDIWLRKEIPEQNSGFLLLMEPMLQRCSSGKVPSDKGPADTMGLIFGISEDPV